MKVLETLERHTDIRVVLALSEGADAFVQLDGQLAGLELRPGSDGAAS